MHFVLIGNSVLLLCILKVFLRHRQRCADRTGDLTDFCLRQGGQSPLQPFLQYKNTEIQKYRNTKKQKYKNTKIQKYKKQKYKKQKYKSTKIQKYKNTEIQKTKIQKYKNTEIQKCKNTFVCSRAASHF